MPTKRTSFMREIQFNPIVHGGGGGGVVFNPPHHEFDVHEKANEQ